MSLSFEPDAADAQAIPTGFVDMPSYGPFHDLVGPLFETRRGDRMVIGLRMAEKHQNGGPMMHGGMFLMLADSAMTRAASLQRPDDCVCVTSALTGEFLAPAHPGDWIEAEVEVLKTGRKVVFLNCLMRRGGPDGPLLMRASATFQIVARRS